MSHGASKTLYDGNENLLFIYPALDNEAKRDKKFFEFLVSLGVNTSISFVNNTTGLSWSECKEIMLNANCSSYSYFAYDIRELDYILQNLTQERAKILFEILNSTDDEYFQGELQWKYYSNTTKKHFPSFFVKKLQNEKWILNREGEFVSPNEIYEDEVKSLYGGGKILKYFSFKPDIIKQLPPEEQQILEITRGLPFEYLQQMREQYLQLTTPRSIDIEPENSPVNIDDVDFSNSYNDLSSEELTYMEDFSDMENADISDALDLLYGNSDIPDEIVEKIIVRRSSNEAEVDGDLGERFVISSLKKKYSDEGYKIYNEENNSFSAKKDDVIFSVLRHNTTSKKQKGYDITISKNGDILEYIEVKAKKTDEKELFKVSGLQWEFAKKLYEEGMGDKHFVYVVSNVRSENRTKISKVSNPYKAWIEGSLEADPVRIKY